MARTSDAGFERCRSKMAVMLQCGFAETLSDTRPSSDDLTFLFSAVAQVCFVLFLTHMHRERWSEPSSLTYVAIYFKADCELASEGRGKEGKNRKPVASVGR